MCAASAKTVAPTAKFKSKPVSTNDKPVCRFFLNPDECKNGDTCHMRIRMESVYDVVRKSVVYKTAPVLADNSLCGQACAQQGILQVQGEGQQEEAIRQD